MQPVCQHSWLNTRNFPPPRKNTLPDDEANTEEGASRTGDSILTMSLGHVEIGESKARSGSTPEHFGVCVEGGKSHFYLVRVISLSHETGRGLDLFVLLGRQCWPGTRFWSESCKVK